MYMKTPQNRYPITLRFNGRIGVRLHGLHHLRRPQEAPAKGRPPTRPGPRVRERQQGEANAALAKAEPLKLQACLEGPNLVEDEHASSGFRVSSLAVLNYSTMLIP